MLTTCPIPPPQEELSQSNELAQQEIARLTSVAQSQIPGVARWCGFRPPSPCLDGDDESLSDGFAAWNRLGDLYDRGLLKDCDS